MPPLRLVTNQDPDPVLDTALSAALLHRISSGEIGPTLRMFTPGRVVAFGSQDRTRPGYAAAVEAVNGLGFSAVQRLPGGRAAVFHEGTIALGLSTPHQDPKIGIDERFDSITAIVIDALARLDITASVGETVGEYCPGRFSIQMDGRKVMGVGQRLVKAAAHVGCVLVAHSPELVNRPLIPAYRALGYDWNPDVTGWIGRSVEEVTMALTSAFTAADHSLQPTLFEPETLELANGLAADHRPRIP